jgi:HEAT repeat protein
MYHAVIWTVAALTVLVVGLALLTVLGRMVSDFRRTRREALRARMTKQLSGFLALKESKAATIAALRFDRAAALDALARTATALPRDQRVQLAPLFKHFAFAEQETDVLRHRHWGRRLRAAEHLGVMSDPGVVPTLVHALDDEMLDVRLAAARSLAQLPAPNAIEPILRSLAVPGELPLKLAADVLVEFGDAAIEPLLAFIREHDAITDGPAVAAAITVLGMCRATVALPALVARLSDPEPELRANAARALGSIGSPGALAALCERTRDPVWQVRSTAAQALGRIGDAQAIPSLVGRLVDVAWWVRFNAAEALFHLGYPGRERLLETLAIHEDRFARDISLQVLQEHAASAPAEVLAL